MHLRLAVLTPKCYLLGLHLLRWCTGSPANHSSSYAKLYHEPIACTLP